MQTILVLLTLDTDDVDPTHASIAAIYFSIPELEIAYLGDKLNGTNLDQLYAMLRKYKDQAGADRIALAAHNGYRYHFRVMLREMRRRRVKIPEDFELVDTLHAFQQHDPTLGRLDTCARKILGNAYHAPPSTPYERLQLLERLLVRILPAGKTVYEHLRECNDRWIHSNHVPDPVVSRSGVVNAKPHVQQLVPVMPQPPQPNPVQVPTSEPIYPDLIQWVTMHQDVDVTGLLEERHTFGMQKYGSPLMTHNGRDAERDLLEELGDALFYAHQMYMEGRGDFSRAKNLVWILWTMCNHHDAGAAGVSDETSDDGGGDAGGGAGDHPSRGDEVLPGQPVVPEATADPRDDGLHEPEPDSGAGGERVGSPDDVHGVPDDRPVSPAVPQDVVDLGGVDILRAEDDP